MKSVLITGISKGLGSELFHQFNKKNYFVFGISRSKELEFRYLTKENSQLVYADLTDDRSIAIIREAIGNRPIDLVINNAGIGGTPNRLESTSTKEFINLFNVHCIGAVRVIQATLENLLESPKPLVLNISSRLGSIKEQSKKTFQNLDVSYSYRVAKASQNMLTNCLRNEFEDRIQFISLNPGKMKTQIAQADADLEPSIVASQIIKKYEDGTFKEELGISQLSDKIIEW